MSVKVIGLIRLKDSVAFSEYKSEVGATVALYGGVISDRGSLEKVYWDELAAGHFDAYVELSFPTAETADAWASSPEYQSILAVRKVALDITLFRTS